VPGTAFFTASENTPMDCRKRKHDLEEVLKKSEEGKELDHCEELFYLVNVLHFTEEKAERILYEQQAEKDMSKGTS